MDSLEIWTHYELRATRTSRQAMRCLPLPPSPIPLQFLRKQNIETQKYPFSIPSRNISSLRIFFFLKVSKESVGNRSHNGRLSYIWVDQGWLTGERKKVVMYDIFLFNQNVSQRIFYPMSFLLAWHQIYSRSCRRLNRENSIWRSFLFPPSAPQETLYSRQEDGLLSGHLLPLREREKNKTKQDNSGWNFSFIPNSIAQTFEKMLVLGLIFTKFILRV